MVHEAIIISGIGLPFADCSNSLGEVWVIESGIELQVFAPDLEARFYRFQEHNPYWIVER